MTKLNIEWCGECGEEVELPSAFGAYNCPNCDKHILTCDICPVTNGKDVEFDCDSCPLELDRSEAIPTRLLEDPHRDLEGEVYG